MSGASFSRNGASSSLVILGDPVVRKKSLLLAVRLTFAVAPFDVIVPAISLPETDPGDPKAPSVGFATPVVQTDDAMSAQDSEAEEVKAVKAIAANRVNVVFRIGKLQFLYVDSEYCK